MESFQTAEESFVYISQFFMFNNNQENKTLVVKAECLECITFIFTVVTLEDTLYFYSYICAKYDII